jgi:hypothetical protein
MRLSTSALCTVVAVALLAGCSGLGSTNPSLPTGSQSQNAHTHFKNVSVMPPWMHPAGIARLRLTDRIVPNDATGIYASEFDGFQVFGYADPNDQNYPPSCTLGTTSNFLASVNGFGVDTKGDVMVPAYTPNDSGADSINVFAKDCGGLRWQAPVANAQPTDAFADNAANRNSTIYVSLLLNDSTEAGGLVRCDESGGCGNPFSNAAVTGYGAGVAEEVRNGKPDCWLAAGTQSFSGFVLIYFPKCKGHGEVATGTQNQYYGGLFFDSQGQLGSIDLSGTLYVYKGCDPHCHLVGSSPLQGQSVYGGLNAAGNELAVGDVANSDVDVYSYNPDPSGSGSNGLLNYEYSFNNGLTPGFDEEAAHFAPGN